MGSMPFTRSLFVANDILYRNVQGLPLLTHLPRKSGLKPVLVHFEPHPLSFSVKLGLMFLKPTQLSFMCVSCCFIFSCQKTSFGKNKVLLGGKEQQTTATMSGPRILSPERRC